MIFLRLSKAGYGSVNEVEEWDARKVLQTLHFEAFTYDYEVAHMKLNRGD